MRRYFLRKDETMYYIGVDLGTSAVKLLLMDGAGKIRNVVSREYPLRFPQPGWSEQDPQDWIRESFAGIRELTADIDRSQVAGIGCGGQMHGLVALDAEDRVIRPAILWNDGRTEEETAWLNTEIGKKKLSELTANIAFAGFTAPKLLWMKKNEPENFARIRKIMLPKDYVNYCLTGVHSCDYSDASGMLLLDVEHKRWSREMLEICGVEESWMPQLFESYEIVGTLRPQIAAELARELSSAGVSCEVEALAPAVYKSAVNSGLYDLYVGEYRLPNDMDITGVLRDKDDESVHQGVLQADALPDDRLPHRNACVLLPCEDRSRPRSGQSLCQCDGLETRLKNNLSVKLKYARVCDRIH